MSEEDMIIEPFWPNWEDEAWGPPEDALEKVVGTTFESCNVLSLRTGTNVPRGGDAGHGGVTFLELKDEAATCWEVEVDGQVFKQPSKMVVRLYGDTEGYTFADALEFASKYLKLRMKGEI